MAEIRVNATGGLKLFDADDSHYAQIIAGTITSNVNAITLGHDVVSIVDNLALTSDSSVLKFGADGDTTLTHTDGTGLTLNSTNKLCFNDASQFIQGSSATVLSIGATDEIDLTATAVDLNGTLNVSGVATFQSTPVFPDGSLALADLDIDGGTDIGAAIVDADLFIVDDGAGGTNRKVTASRIKTYAGGAAADDISAGDGAVSISTTSGNITIENDASDGDIIFKVNDGGADKTVFTIDGSDNGKLIFQDDVAAISLDKLIGKHDTNTGIDFGVTVGSGDASAADPTDVISFTTGGTETMRLVEERNNYTTLALGNPANVQYNGYVFVHGENAAQTGCNIAKFDHQGTSPYGVVIEFANAAPDNNTQFFFNCADNSASRCRIESDGDLQNHDNSYGSISDSRIKDNIADASSQWDDIKALKVRKFKMKDDILQYGADNATYKLGLIAQETEVVSPGLIKKRVATVGEVKHSSEFGTVVNDTDAPIIDKHQNPVLDGDGNPTYQKKVVPKEGDAALVRQMKYSILYMKAIKALQEAQTRIETLESKVKTLEDA